MAMRSPLPPRDGVGATRLRVPREGPWATIAEYIVERFGHLDRGFLEARIARGEMVVADGTPITLATPLGAAEFIWYFREPPIEREIPFEIEVLHQDDDLVVIDKPHFLPTTPGGKYLQSSALIRLRRLLGNDDITPIHRLDRLTAGLVMFSARPESRGPYQLLFERREVEKVYEAVSDPPAAPLAFPLTIRSHIRKTRGVLTVEEIPGAEPNAETVIDAIEQDDRMLHTLLRPRTGQMHQLRVHLASVGAGIRFDPFYPVLLPETPDDFTRPLQLLARELRFTDPLSGTPHDFRSRRRLDGFPRQNTTTAATRTSVHCQRRCNR